MDLIQDKANKFINEVRKKKVKINKHMHKDNKEQLKQNPLPISDLSNSCFYCEKVFFSSRFLLKHILRRHSENLLLLYSKCLKQESNNNSSDMKHLISFIEKEFLVLRNELKMVKRAVVGNDIENDATASRDINFESQENICNVSRNDANEGENRTDIHSNEIKALTEKISELETNIQSLQNNYKELDNILKTDALLKQDIKEHMNINNEKILRIQESHFVELSQTLLKDLQTMLSKQLHENNIECRMQISELKHEIQKLDHVVSVIKEQVDSPDYVNALEEKIEHQITTFLNNARHNSRKAVSKTRITDSKMNKTKDINLRIKSKLPESHKFDKKLVASAEHKQAHVISCISSSESACNEKLFQLGIPPNTSKISCAEFDKKLKLVNFEKESLKKLYPKFDEVHNDINMNVDHQVNMKFRHKKFRKIRFSEPLSSCTNAFNEPVLLLENCQNETYPSVESKIRHSNVVKNQKSPDHEHEELTFTDVGGGGDCTWNFSYINNRSSEDVLELAPVKSGLKTSSPIEDTLYSQKSDYSKNSLIYSLPSSSSKTADSEKEEVGKNSEDVIQNSEDGQKNLFVRNFKEVQNCNGDDFDDDESLQSLSSWES